ncbi:MAG TPA: outer membrane beta-barrel protein [Terriglobales bacterium]|nr:outer membrane beta-barrel protein [Terriglobales bacterium]
MLRFKSFLVLALAVCASSTWAQLMPKAEVVGGYTYSNLDQGFGGANRLSANGWNTGGTFFVNNWLGFEGNVAGVSHSESALFSNGITTSTGSASEKHTTFVVGPRIDLGHGRTSPFVHGLIGMDRETLSASGTLAGLSFSDSASDTSFATALGGGVDFGVSKHLGVITGADYLMTRHGVPASIAALGVSGSSTQNNFRVSVGLSFRFGSGWSSPKY